MAAHAAAVSVLNTLSSLLGSNHQFSNTPNYPELRIEILQGVYALKYFLKKNPEIKSDFETRIRDAIYEAEDIIDSHISLEAEISQSFCGDLERVIEKINSIVEMTKEEFNHLTLDRQIPFLAWRPHFDCSRTNQILIGRSEDIIQLKDRLITGSASLQVVPIVGIPGMGKTALARHVFEDLSIREHFFITCWVKVPTEYHKRDVLLRLLESMKKRGEWFRYMTDEQLAKYVYNVLKNKRYLAVFDNIRDIVVWNDLKQVLPDYDNGSRILLATRNMNVAPAPPHQLDRLSDKDTLALLENLAFDDERLPLEFFVIAKDIAWSCRGLPLAVVIIGKLLACAELSSENWEIALSSISTCKKYVDLTEAVISLTYRHLPPELKLSLLYIAMFPFDYEISLFKVINLLISERFFQRPKAFRPLENQASRYLEELHRRDLVRYSFKDFQYRLKFTEEVFHEFIVRKGEEEKFFLVISKDTNNVFLQEKSTYSQQRLLCIWKNIHHFIKDMSTYNSNASISSVRSLLYMGPEHQYPLQSWLDFKLLKVLDAPKIRFYTFPSEILKLLQLRYLALSYNGELPVAVCKLQNLQILIVLRYLSVKRTGAPSYLPMEIWNMKELRHLQVMGSDLPDLPSDTNLLLLEHIVTLSDVGSHSCTKHILERLRKLKRLRIRIESPLEDESSLSFFSHLDILDGLQRFKCVVMHPDMGSHQVVSSSIPVFPHSLVKLSLSGCGFPWEYMRAIATLPYLTWLKLRSYSFRGPEWEVKEDEFPWLRFLLLEDMDLEKWILADGSFPELKSLIIRHCYKLQEFPSEFADITTLRTIEVEDCNSSVMDSAQKINKNRKDVERGPIKVDLFSSLDD